MVMLLIYWQGIRYLSDNFYLICGTNRLKEGVVYIGDLLNYNPNNNYRVKYPGSSTTSIYGPDYIDNGNYRLVGSYENKNDTTVYGLFFQGTLLDLENSNNYKTINIGLTFTFVHSTIENILVGNYDQSYLGPIQAFLMIIDTGKIINISYPGARSNTLYGVWYDGDGNYTLCGGYSYLDVNVNQVYVKNIIKPFGLAFMVNYNIKTNEFKNWTTFNYPYLNNGILSNNVLTHFEGISSSEKNKYQLATDTIFLDKIITSFVEVSKDKFNNFIVSKWIDFSYPLPGIILSSSNSVANNTIIGLYIDKENSSTAFQLKIE